MDVRRMDGCKWTLHGCTDGFSYMNLISIRLVSILYNIFSTLSVLLPSNLFPMLINKCCK